MLIASPGAASKSSGRPSSAVKPTGSKSCSRYSARLGSARVRQTVPGWETSVHAIWPGLSPSQPYRSSVSEGPWRKEGISQNIVALETTNPTPAQTRPKRARRWNSIAYNPKAATLKPRFSLLSRGTSSHSEAAFRSSRSSASKAAMKAGMARVSG
jgi:hypothetical protein